MNAAGCGSHLKELGELLGTDEAKRFSAKVRDVMEFLHDEGLSETPTNTDGAQRVAYHDACHALRAQKIKDQPRALLRRIPGLEIHEIPGGDVCCGAAGLYNVLEPEMSSELRRRKAEAIASTGASVVASANPGCTMQIVAGLREFGSPKEVVHPVDCSTDLRTEAAPAASGDPTTAERLTRLRVVARDHHGAVLGRGPTWMFTPASATARAISPIAPGRSTWSAGNSETNGSDSPSTLPPAPSSAVRAAAASSTRTCAIARPSKLTTVSPSMLTPAPPSASPSSASVPGRSSGRR